MKFLLIKYTFLFNTFIFVLKCIYLIKVLFEMSINQFYFTALSLSLSLSHKKSRSRTNTNSILLFDIFPQYKHRLTPAAAFLNDTCKFVF